MGDDNDKLFGHEARIAVLEAEFENLCKTIKDQMDVQKEQIDVINTAIQELSEVHLKYKSTLGGIMFAFSAIAAFVVFLFNYGQSIVNIAHKVLK